MLEALHRFEGIPSQYDVEMIPEELIARAAYALQHGRFVPKYSECPGNDVLIGEFDLSFAPQAVDAPFHKDPASNRKSLHPIAE